MAVDASTTIAAFNTALPAGSDSRAEADDNFRHIKTVIKAAFPNVAGAVSATDVQLSYVTGVTSAIQTQINTLTSTKGAIAGQVWTGAHDFTGATPTVPTATLGDSSSKAASTAFAAAAIAAVNAASGNLTRGTNAGTSFTVGAGQLIASTSAAVSGPVAVTFPSSPTTGQVAGVWFDNGRTDNTVDIGSNQVVGLNGTFLSGVITIDVLSPVVWAFYGDKWRAA